MHVYRLITQDSVEERLIRRAEKKLYLDMMVMGRSNLGINQADMVQSLLSLRAHHWQCVCRWRNSPKPKFCRC